MAQIILSLTYTKLSTLDSPSCSLAPLHTPQKPCRVRTAVSDGKKEGMDELLNQTKGEDLEFLL